MSQKPPITGVANPLGTACRFFMTSHVPLYREGGTIRIPLRLDGTDIDTGVPAADSEGWNLGQGLARYLLANSRYFASINPRAFVHESRQAFNAFHRPEWLVKVTAELGEEIHRYRDQFSKGTERTTGFGASRFLSERWGEIVPILGGLLYMENGGYPKLFDINPPDLALYCPPLDPARWRLGDRLNLLSRLVGAALVLHHGMLPKFRVKTTRGGSRQVYDPGTEWRPKKFTTVQMGQEGETETIYFPSDDDRVVITYGEEVVDFVSPPLGVSYPGTETSLAFSRYSGKVRDAFRAFYLLAHYRMTAEEIATLQALILILKSRPTEPGLEEGVKRFLMERRPLTEDEANVAAAALTGPMTELSPSHASYPPLWDSPRISYTTREELLKIRGWEREMARILGSVEGHGFFLADKVINWLSPLFSGLQGLGRGHLPDREFSSLVRDLERVTLWGLEVLSLMSDEKKRGTPLSVAFWSRMIWPKWVTGMIEEVRNVDSPHGNPNLRRLSPELRRQILKIGGLLADATFA